MSLSHYRDYISGRDFQYFHTYQEKDQLDILAEAREKMVQKNALLVKQRVQDSLLTLVAHELTTPICTIVGAIELSRNEKPKYLDLFERSCTKLLAITNRLQNMDVLAESAALPTDEVTYDLRNVVNSIVDSFMHVSSAINLSFSDDIPNPLKGNLPRINGLILNLALLAAGCSKNDRFDCKVDLDSDLAARVTFYVASVSDTYPFYDQDAVKPIDLGSGSLFDYQSLEGRYVGYLIARRCAEIIGATIEVHDREDAQLVISCLIPLKRDDDDMHTQCRLESNNRSRPPKFRILVVDDNCLNRKLMQKMVINLGHEADTAIDGQDCIEQVTKRPGYYHAIFMDCDMPVMSGFDATDYIRNDLGDKSVFIVALTADASSSCKIRCLKVGMDDYFIKPATQTLIDIMLNKWFH